MSLFVHTKSTNRRKPFNRYNFNTMRLKSCSYCGRKFEVLQREHVFPDNLYPKNSSDNKVQRLTIPACDECNKSWSDDEVHFRNVLIMAGLYPNSSRQELFSEKMMPSFDEVDGFRRMMELMSLMKPVSKSGQQLQQIFPAEDERVLRVVRKIIRGLSHFHNLETAVPDNRVWADVLRYEIPPEYLATMESHDRDPNIVSYKFNPLNEPGIEIQSAWVIKFFNSVNFIGFVVENSFDKGIA